MKTINEINFESGKKITITKGFWDYVWKCVTISLWGADGKLLDNFSADTIDAVYDNLVQFSTSAYTYLMTEDGCIRVIRTQQSSNSPSKEYYICEMLRTKKLGVIIKEFVPEVRMFISVPFEWHNPCQTIEGTANRVLMMKEECGNFCLVDLDNNKVLCENIYPYSQDCGTAVIREKLLPVYKYDMGEKIVGVISIENGEIIIPFKFSDIIFYHVKEKTLFQCFDKEGSEFYNKDGNCIISRGEHKACFSKEKSSVVVETIEYISDVITSGKQNFKIKSVMFTKIHTQEIW